jgi:hypothetical protein
VTDALIDSIVEFDKEINSRSTESWMRYTKNYAHGADAAVRTFFAWAKCTFARGPNCCVRSFRIEDIKDNYAPVRGTWFTVVTDKDDVEIVEVKCGVGLTPAE